MTARKRTAEAAEDVASASADTADETITVEHAAPVAVETAHPDDEFEVRGVDTEEPGAARGF